MKKSFRFLAKAFSYGIKRFRFVCFAKYAYLFSMFYLFIYYLFIWLSCLFIRMRCLFFRLNWKHLIVTASSVKILAPRYLK